MAKKVKQFDENGVEIKKTKRTPIVKKISENTDGDIMINDTIPGSLTLINAAIKKLGIKEQYSGTLAQNYEVSLLIRNYYRMQLQRIRLGNQRDKLKEAGKEFQLIEEMFNFFEAIEKRIVFSMDCWNAHPDNTIAHWLRSIHGIGPILTAGWVSMIDIEKAHTSGSIMRYIGMDDNLIWLTDDKLIGENLDACMKDLNVSKIDYGVMALACNILSRKNETMEKWMRDIKGYKTLDNIKKKDAISFFKLCPYNKDAKQLAWKTWQSFFNQRNSPNDVYGKIIDQRIAYEIVKNNRGDYADQAKIVLDRLVDKESDTYKIYASGKLPISHIINRAGRFCVKIFVSHFQAIYYWVHYGKIPPRPYVMEYLGHKDFIKIPNDHLVNFPQEYYIVGERKYSAPEDLGPELQAVKAKMAAEMAARKADRAAKNAAKNNKPTSLESEEE